MGYDPVEQAQIEKIMMVTNGGNNVEEDYVQFSPIMDSVMVIIDAIKMVCFSYFLIFLLF